MSSDGERIVAAGGLVSTLAAAPPAIGQESLARPLGGERTLAMLLRAGGVLGGICFLASLPLQALPATAHTEVAVDLLRKAGASFLIVTPVARLGAAGLLLALKGEWRYLGYAAATMGLLALVVGAHIAA